MGFMKAPRFLTALFLTVVLATALRPPAAMAAQNPGGSDVFLQGDYLEVGIDDNGYFGTSEVAPAGFHQWATVGNRLGFVSDNDKDGWDQGTPNKSGDYFLPGSPEQGFSIEWGTAPEVLCSTNGSGGQQNITTLALTESSSGTVQSAVWTGRAQNPADADQKLEIQRTVSLNAEDVFFLIRVDLTNSGTETLASLQYMENVDPDQESGVPGGSGTATINQVKFQSDGVAKKSLVMAAGQTWPNVALGLGAMDTRARVSHGGFNNDDPDDVLNTSGGPFNYTPGVPNTADQAISLAFDLGDLAPGETVTFYYGYVLNEDDVPNLEQALEEASTPSEHGPEPRVVWTEPAAGSRNAPLDTAVKATFDQDMDLTTIAEDSFTLTRMGASQAAVTGTVSYDATSRQAVLRPGGLLSAGAQYRARLTTDVQATGGAALEEAYTWTFHAGRARDTDGDGVPDDVDLFPNDNQVATPDLASGDGKVTIDVSGTTGARLSGVHTVAANDSQVNQSGRPVNYRFPFALIAFAVEDVTPGATADVLFTFEDYLLDDSRWYKVGDQGFSPYPYVTFDGYTALFILTDGGNGDADGSANGRIPDPGGPAVLADSDTAWGDGGCFIEALR